MSEGSDPAPPEEPSAAADGTNAEAAGGARGREVPGLVGRGFCMGSADVVPGVSGGTMALILGIYARLIAAIKSFDRDALGHLVRLRLRSARDRVHWRFLGSIVVGQALGLVMFTRVLPLPVWLEVYPEQVYGLFFGLILGSVLVIGGGLVRERLDARLALPAAAGLALGIAITQARAGQTPEAPWFVFLCGCVAICAMVLPGISGSFILLILGQYAHVLGGIGEAIHPQSGVAADRLVALRDVVLPFALGAVVGLVAFSRLLSWLLARAERATLAAMTGLLAGSLGFVWPFQERIYEEVKPGERKLVGTAGLRLPAEWDGGTWLAIGLALAGFTGVVGLDHVARRRRTAAPDPPQSG